MEKKKVVVIEDDATLGPALQNFLTRELQCEVSLFGDVEKAIKQIDNTTDLVVSDVVLPGLSGFDLLKFIKKKFSKIPLILMTGHGSIENAVVAMKEGAYDFLVKPFTLPVFETSVQAAFLDKEPNVNFVYKDTVSSSLVRSERPVTSGFITSNPKMQELVGQIKKVAGSKATVLIQGESGTGKELLARMLHDFSPRANRIFVGINVAAMPDTLLESELFGHEKGAFTGATGRQIGKFELSNHGTILLDEISEMSLPMQTKLLRVIQESEIYRLGGAKSIPLDLRIVATTNRDLASYTKDGQFREDLYYRLNVIPLFVPPLRERGDDVILLTNEFLKEFAVLHAKKPLVLDEKSSAKILAYNWPGNVRQLRNVIERISLMGSFDVLDEAFEETKNEKTKPGHDHIPITGLTLDEIEKEVILKTLHKNGGNKSKTSELLGITLRTLRNKLELYGYEGKTV